MATRRSQTDPGANSNGDPNAFAEIFIGSLLVGLAAKDPPMKLTQKRIAIFTENIAALDLGALPVSGPRGHSRVA
jgi:hypothetical protein